MSAESNKTLDNIHNIINQMCERKGMPKPEVRNEANQRVVCVGVKRTIINPTVSRLYCK